MGSAYWLSAPMSFGVWMFGNPVLAGAAAVIVAVSASVAISVVLSAAEVRHVGAVSRS
jgi:hypothetical protein